jgi:hypothetical protein
MNPKVEEALKEADHTARLLGDMKHGIAELKAHGGISEADKMEALWGFCDQADDILKNLRRAIHAGQQSLDKDSK